VSGSPQADVVPATLNRGDPAAGDESLFVAGSHHNYARFGFGTLGPAAYDAAEEAFHRDISAWLAGALPFSALLPHRERLGLELRPHHDTRPLPVCEVELPDEVLADAVENEVPDAGVLFERILGEHHGRPTVGAMAALAWLETLGPNRRGVDAWAEDERDRALVLSMRRIDRSPPCLYQDGIPLLPLSPRMVPPGGPAGIYVARAYRLGERWAFSSRVELSALPAMGPLLRRLRVEGWRLRTRERRSTWEDVLRQRSSVLYRAAAEGAARAVLKL
jgi:hypothetical protein